MWSGAPAAAIYSAGISGKHIPSLYTITRAVEESQKHLVVACNVYLCLAVCYSTNCGRSEKARIGIRNQDGHTLVVPDV